MDQKSFFRKNEPIEPRFIDYEASYSILRIRVVVQNFIFIGVGGSNEGFSAGYRAQSEVSSL